jgi:transcriptional regulator with XRE-family HTH domain
VSADTRTADDRHGLTAATIAERLGVERRRLLQFVEFHPDPTASYVLGWARAGPKHEDAVEAWLDARDDAPHADLSDADPVAQDDGRRGWLVR